MPTSPAGTTADERPAPSPAEQQRTSYIGGLRQLADILEHNPAVPLPFEGRRASLSFYFLSGDDAKDRLAAAVRCFPGTKDKHVNDAYFDVRYTLAGLKLTFTALREQVCERVVTGTREVARQVQDADALAAVPTVTVVETEDIVEWVCSPLLADSKADTEPVPA